MEILEEIIAFKKFRTEYFDEELITIINTYSCFKEKIKQNVYVNQDDFFDDLQILIKY